MIHVVATMSVKPDCLDDFVDELKRIVDDVRQEEGCLEYELTIDFESGISTQNLNPYDVVIVEKWKTIDDLHNHRAAPHLREYKSRTRNMIEQMAIKVLQPL